jgi:hypothetical protein
MSDKPSFPEEPMVRQIESSKYQIPTESAIPPEFDREEFDSERGDTGLLLSQLDDLMTTASSNPVIADSSSIPPVRSYSIPDFAQPQGKISSSDIEDIDRKSNRQKWLLALAMIITATIGGVGVSAYMSSSFRSVPPTDSSPQLK